MPLATTNVQLHQQRGCGSLHRRVVPLEGRIASSLLQLAAANEAARARKEEKLLVQAWLLHLRPLVQLLGLSQEGGCKITAHRSPGSGDECGLAPPCNSNALHVLKKCWQSCGQRGFVTALIAS